MNERVTSGIGRQGSRFGVVGEDDTAARYGPEFPPAASTPYVLGLAEVAAHSAIEPLLKADEITVGTNATIAHLAPSAVGASLEATATVVASEGSRFEFVIEVRERETVVARIEHTRAIVNGARFRERLAQGRRDP
jgi:fluoroacetyl-CoA thioesterase